METGASNMLKILVFLLILYDFSLGCHREPSVYHSRVAKIPGDNGYKVKLQDDLQKYVPGEVYTGEVKRVLYREKL